MAEFTDKVAFITGGSSGIGLELGRQLVARGAKVALAARRLESMKAAILALPESVRANALAVRCDVTDEGDLRRAVEETTKAFGRVDLVFANAGFGVSGKVQDLTLADYERQADTNVWGVVRTLYATLEELKRNKGTFVVSGSIAGHLAVKGLSAYSLSKFAVRGFCEAIEADLAPLGIGVLHLSCGFIESEIARKDNHGRLKEGGRSSAPRRLVVPTEKGVRDILDAVSRRRGDVVITGHGKAFLAANRAYADFNRVLERAMKL